HHVVRDVALLEDARHPAVVVAEDSPHPRRVVRHHAEQRARTAVLTLAVLVEQAPKRLWTHQRDIRAQHEHRARFPEGWGHAAHRVPGALRQLLIDAPDATFERASHLRLRRAHHGDDLTGAG